MNMLTRPKVQTVREIIGGRWPGDNGTMPFSKWRSVRATLAGHLGTVSLQWLARAPEDLGQYPDRWP